MNISVICNFMWLTGIEKIKGIHLNSITYGLNRIVWIIILEMILNIKVIYPIL